MCDNEYLAHRMIQERLREAEARGALNTMLREASRLRQTRDTAAGRRPAWLQLWQTPAAWVAHLALPKTWNRL
ncbi:MAG: hypothetical protein ACRELZ_01875 [Candidatus Rokuibacteriota bacterium]